MQDEQLHAFLGDARANAAVDVRRRRRWLARQLDEDRAFDDVCARAVRDGTAVDVVVTGGRTHRGCLVASDAHVVTVAVVGGGTAYIARAAVTGVRLRPRVVVGDRTVTAGAARRSRTLGADDTIGDVVRELADGCVQVRIGTLDGGMHHGRIDGVGRDVLRLSDGMHLRLDAVTEVVTVR